MRSCLRAVLVAVLLLAAALALSACGASLASDNGSTGDGATTTSSSLPPGVMSAVEACKQVVDRPVSGFFTDVEQVHLVLTRRTAERAGSTRPAAPQMS